MGQPGLIVRAREHVVALDGRTLLLLCSDGLSGMLSTHEMEAILSDDESLVDQAISMVSAAANREDSDNTSTILVRIG
jgi:protein phosphatase